MREFYEEVYKRMVFKDEEKKKEIRNYSSIPTTPSSPLKTKTNKKPYVMKKKQKKKQQKNKVGLWWLERNKMRPVISSIMSKGIQIDRHVENPHHYAN